MALGGDLNLTGTITVAANQRGTFTVGADAQESGLIVGGKISFLSGMGMNLNQSAYMKIGDATGTTIFDQQNSVDVLTRVSNGSYDSTPRINLQIHQDASTVAQNNVIDFNGAFNNFRAYSNAISNLTPTLSMTNNSGSGNINLVANQTNILNITGTVLATYSTIIFNQQPSATQPLIINVDATGLFDWTLPTFSGIGDTQGAFILFNFYNTDFLNISSGNTLYGTVFAPNTDFTKSNSGNINGQVIAKAYTHVEGELHHHPLNFDIDLTLPDTEICGNGLDDDNDGFTDNYDDDCCAKLSIIPQSNYSLHYTDSEQTGFGEAINTFDGDTDTYWHTNFDNTTYPSTSRNPS